MRAVVVVEVLLDVRVRHDARPARRAREVRRGRGPVRVQDVEAVGQRVGLGDVAHLVLALEVGGDVRIVLGRAGHDGMQRGGRLRVARGKEGDLVARARRAPASDGRSRSRCRHGSAAERRSRPTRSARSSRGEADGAGFREQFEVLGDRGKGNRGVAAGEDVADLRDRSLAVGEVDRLVGDDVAVLALGERGLRQIGARDVGEVVVVVDVERADDRGIARRDATVRGRPSGAAGSSAEPPCRPRPSSRCPARGARRNRGSRSRRRSPRAARGRRPGRARPSPGRCGSRRPPASRRAGRRPRSRAARRGCRSARRPCRRRGRASSRRGSRAGPSACGS